MQNNLCTPKNGEILVASTQDFLTSSFLVTRKDTFYDRSAFTNICTFIGDGLDLIDLPTPAIVKVRLHLIDVTGTRFPHMFSHFINLRVHIYLRVCLKGS